jgi:hypothetical protein
LGYVSLQQQNWQEAHTWFVKSLTVHGELGEKGGVASCLAGLAGVAERQGQGERAAQLLGVTESLLESSDPHLAPFFSFVRRIFKFPLRGTHATRGEAYPETIGRIEYERIVNAVCSALSEEAFAAAFAKGREMTLEEAIAYALEG